MSSETPKGKSEKHLTRFDLDDPSVGLWKCPNCHSDMSEMDDSDYCLECGSPFFSQRLKGDGKFSGEEADNESEYFEPDQSGCCLICDNNPDSVEGEFCMCGQVSRWHMERTYAEEDMQDPFI